ncbi:hypothetical protein CKO42_12810 [Lamprobacter modestohalophilus]|uniref:Uncharacterized protein n=1 Tax=Lamprobacter modestohalophilus TaxID=1064514 RepID=A0A9X0W9J4_9GAMM|nr:hypothetical protein [Lamprobacter modestohalophilus]MBK1619301.1 hypothetical protein [Lamprobacter modestohalophilus]
MNAIEFDALPEQRSIHLPEEVPDGVRLRVVLLWEQPGTKGDDLKTLFASTTEGLTDEDLERPRDLGRDVQWDF